MNRESVYIITAQFLGQGLPDFLSPISVQVKIRGTKKNRAYIAAFLYRIRRLYILYGDRGQARTLACTYAVRIK